LTQNPDDADALGALILLAGRPPDVKAAEELRALLTAALQRRPSDEGLQLASARLLEATGQQAGAIAGLEAYRQTEAGRNTVNVLLTLADFYRDAGNLASCGQRIDQAVALAPDSPGVVHQQILRLAAEKKFDDVFSLMSAYKGRKAVDPRILLVGAGVLRSAGSDGHLRNARTLYEEATRIAPGLDEAYLGLALLAYQTGDVKTAEQACHKVLELYPNHPQALNDLAWILSESRQDLRKALELADKGVSLAPDDDHLRDTRGVILLKLGRFQDALKDFERSAQLSPPDSLRRAKALVQMSRACAKLKDLPQAKRHLGEALRIDTQKNVFTPEEKAELNQMLLSLPS
jgi:tetratricopeptide (TPR) repeat protein